MKARILLAAFLLWTPVAWADGPVHDQGRRAFGAGLDYNSHFNMVGGFHAPTSGDVLTNSSFTLTVQDVCKPAGDPYPPNIPAYRCNVTSDKPICSGASTPTVTLSGPAPAPADPTEYPIVVVKGYWTDNAHYVPEDVTAGCSVPDPMDEDSWKAEWAAALAKCVEKWKMNAADPKLLRSCVHMARAAYLGTDQSFTENGTPVDAWDLANGTHGEGEQHLPGCTMIQHPAYHLQTKLVCAMWLEAEWDNEGATCINHFRWVDLGSPIQFAKADIRAKEANGIRLNCRTDILRAANVAEDVRGPVHLSVTQRKALLRNRSEMHLLNAAGVPGKIPCMSGGDCAKRPPPPRKNWDSSACWNSCPTQ